MTGLGTAILRLVPQRIHRVLDAAVRQVAIVRPADEGAWIGAAQQRRAPALDRTRGHLVPVGGPAVEDVHPDDELESPILGIVDIPVDIVAGTALPSQVLRPGGIEVVHRAEIARFAPHDGRETGPELLAVL